MKVPAAFSVIIPTYNRIASLDKCVRGLAALDFPNAKMQVIVVNDGGAEIPMSMQQAWAQVLNISIVSQPNAGPAAARNFGVQHALHEWIAFTDDDCLPAADWLTQLELALASAPDAVVGGETVNGLRENVYAEASQALILFLLDYYHQTANGASQIAFFPSNNIALARRTFEHVGGFEPTMRNAEERDFCARLDAAGFRLKYVRAARVVHYRPMNLATFWKQHLAYGHGAYQFQSNHTLVTRKGIRPEPFRFYGGMLGYSKKHALPRAGRVAGLVALSQIANAFGFFQESLRAQFGSRT